MREFEKMISVERLKEAKRYLVPYILSENYYGILKKKLAERPLSANEKYYYSHFIRKKLLGMIELFGFDEMIDGKVFIRKDRLRKAAYLLRRYSRIHKGMKILVSGSFLYSNDYNDIDIFIISKYDKEDYRDGKVHINYLPIDVEKTLFFSSIRSISISNFDALFSNPKKIEINDLLHSYEVVVLLMLQKDDYLQELRYLILNLEYLSSSVILNSMQLKAGTDKIMSSKNPVKVISKYLSAKIIGAYSRKELQIALKRFICKNLKPESKASENWKVYNNAYKEALEIVA